MRDFLKALAGIVIFVVCVMVGGFGGCYAGAMTGSASMGGGQQALGGLIWGAMIGGVLGVAGGIWLAVLLLRRLRD